MSSGGGHWDPGVPPGFPWGFELDMKTLIPRCKDNCSVTQDPLQRSQGWQSRSDHSKLGLVSGTGLSQLFLGARGRTKAGVIRAGAIGAPGRVGGLEHRCVSYYQQRNQPAFTSSFSTSTTGPFHRAGAKCSPLCTSPPMLPTSHTSDFPVGPPSSP